MSRIQFSPVSGTHKTKDLTAVAVSLAGLSVTLKNNTQFVGVQAEAGDVRYTVDGTAPSATVGYLLRQTDSPIILSRGEADNAKFYALAGAATIQLSEYSA